MKEKETHEVNLIVDAGNICFFDPYYIEKTYDVKRDESVKMLIYSIPVPYPGNYEVEAWVNLWKKSHKKKIIYLEKELMVGDLCYFFSNKDKHEGEISAYQEILKETNFLNPRKDRKQLVIFSTGGDGVANIRFTIKHIPYHD